MTPKDSTYIDFREFPAIDITCEHCHSVIRIALPKHDLSASVFCVGCNTQLWFQNSREQQNLLGILQLLSWYKENASGMKFLIGISLAPLFPASDVKA
jgi:hypothetical protein